MANQPPKRSRSPSPQGQGYWKGTSSKFIFYHQRTKGFFKFFFLDLQNMKMEKLEAMKVDEPYCGTVSINVNIRLNELYSQFFAFLLSVETTYQNPTGTMYYPSNNQQDSRVQSSIIYPTYPPNLNIPHRPSYHVEISPQQQPPSSQSQQMKSDSKPTQNAQVYHINLDPPQSQQHKQHPMNQQVTLDKIHRGPPQQQQQQQHHSQQQSQQGHLSESIVYSMRPGMPPIHANVMSAMPPNQQVREIIFFLQQKFELKFFRFHSRIRNPEVLLKDIRIAV